MKAQSTVEQKLTRARTQLLLNQPFFGTLCLRLKLMLSAGEQNCSPSNGGLVINGYAYKLSY